MKAESLSLKSKRVNIKFFIEDKGTEEKNQDELDFTKIINFVLQGSISRK